MTGDAHGMGCVSPNPQLPCPEPLQLGRGKKSGLAAVWGCLISYKKIFFFFSLLRHNAEKYLLLP